VLILLVAAALTSFAVGERTSALIILLIICLSVGQRIAQLTHKHGQRARAVTAQRVGPDPLQPRPCLVVREARGAGLQPPEGIVGRKRRRRSERQGAPVCRL
jgi:hypothetical protein